MTSLLFTFLLIYHLVNPAVEAPCPCSLRWVWLDSEKEIEIKNKPHGKTLFKVKNHPSEEHTVMFEVLDNESDWLKIKTMEPDTIVTGWILSSLTAAHTRNYSGAVYTVYQQPTEDSILSGIIKEESKVNILKCCGEWTKIKYRFDGKWTEGYIKNNLLCGNFYSTCS